MKIQKFDGGLSTRLDAHLIPTNQSPVNLNIDNSKGSLSPVGSNLVTDEDGTTGMKWFYSENYWVQNRSPTTYVEYNSTMYYTDGTNPRKLKGGVSNLLGIAKPLAPSVVTVLEGPEPLTGVEVSLDRTEGGLRATPHNYLLFNIKNGVKSEPHRITEKSLSPTIISVSVDPEQNTDIPPFAGYRPIYTPGVGELRSIRFSNFVGAIGDSIEVYKYIQNDWRLIGSATSETDIIKDLSDDQNSPTPGAPLVDATIGVFNGTYTYVYTYYNSSDGSESAPSAPSNELLIQGSTAYISLVASTDPQVDKIRLYRVGGNLAVFTMVQEVNNAGFSYTDTLGDTEVDGRTLQSENFEQPPIGLLYLTEAYAMFFGAEGNKLRFTPINNVNAWPEEYFLQYRDPITGIAQVSNGILVMTRDEIHLVTGTGPFSLSSQLLTADEGCISNFSIQPVELGMVVWASGDGLCTSSGNDVKNITRAAIGNRVFNPTTSAVVDGVYYMQELNGTIFSWDYRFSPIFKELNLGSVGVYKKGSVLYGNVGAKIASLMTESEPLAFVYKSPTFIEGSYTDSKTYSKFYFRSIGELLVKIYIDGQIVITKNLSGDDSHMIKIPQDKQRGFSCAFEISGTGTVFEVEYFAAGGKNA